MILVVPAMENTPWKEAGNRIRSSRRWREYWEGYRPRIFLKEEEYRDILHPAGFASFTIKKFSTKDPFIDREEAVNWMEGSLFSRLPKADKKKFCQEWLEEYLRLRGCLQNPIG